MASLHESAYPRLKSNLTPKELNEIYTPDTDELEFASNQVRRLFARLALLIQMKLFQRLGYFMPVAEVPEQIREHIATSCGFRRLPDHVDFTQYDVSGTRQIHRKLLRAYFNVRTLGTEGRRWLETIAESTAKTKNTVIDIINVLLEELVHHRYELPAFRTLHDIAEHGRKRVHDHYYESISGVESTFKDDKFLPGPTLHFQIWFLKFINVPCKFSEFERLIGEMPCHLKNTYL